MQITRSSLQTGKGSTDWFTGDVYLDTVATPTDPARAAAALVHFTPAARTAWHTHPLGQTIYVTEGIGRCQREGGPVEEIRSGDRVFSRQARITGTGQRQSGSWFISLSRRRMTPGAR